MEWQKPKSGGKITDDTDGYKIDEGTYDEASHTQTTVLTIPKSKNIADSAYTCIVHSHEHKKSEEEKVVKANVFSKYLSVIVKSRWKFFKWVIMGSSDQNLDN